MLDGVQRRALGGEQGARVAAQPQQDRRPASTPGAVLDQPLDLHLGIERAEEGFGDRQAGDDDRLAAVHHPGEARLGRE